MKTTRLTGAALELAREMFAEQTSTIAAVQRIQEKASAEVNELAEVSTARVRALWAKLLRELGHEFVEVDRFGLNLNYLVDHGIAMLHEEEKAKAQEDPFGVLASSFTVPTTTKH